MPRDFFLPYIALRCYPMWVSYCPFDFSFTMGANLSQIIDQLHPLQKRERLDELRHLLQDEDVSMAKFKRFNF